MLLFISCNQVSNIPWPVYRGDNASSGYSPLTQINSTNLDQLEVAWIYQSGDAREGNRSAIQCNPVIIDTVMYATSPQLKLIALDARKGKEIWRFDPFVNEEATGVNRGVTYWENDSEKRIFFSAGPYLYAVNAETGKLVSSFGDEGKIDLRKGLGRDPSKLAVWSTSPGIIYKNVLVMGTALGEGYDAAPGFVRGYDIITGKTVWTFHTIPQPGEFGYDTWQEDAWKEAGGVNAWAGLSLDEATGTVFLPLGSPAFDFYGGNRKGNNLFGNCLVALNALTGKRIWHYQLVHHDLWDYDLPAPPTLVTVERDGKTIPAVAQTTKMGMVFLFNRNTGEPVYPIQERPVPQSTLIGEQTSATQPFPVKPPPFVRQNFPDAGMLDFSDSSYRYIKNKIGNAKTGPVFTPPDTAGVVQFPGTRGGAEWGGASFDPETGMLYVNANEIPMLIKMKPVIMDGNDESKGQQLYTLNNCTMCHGSDRKGTHVYPALLGLSKKYSFAEISGLLQSGRGQMPAYPNLTEEDKTDLIAFLLRDNAEVGEQQAAASTHVRYVHDGWNELKDQDGYPGVKPPWGTLNAIDLNKGEIAWQVPLGEYPELTAKNIPATGTQNLGGALVTAGGIVIIGATRDEKLRIFDKKNGRLLWEYQLPAGGYATPATYMIDNRQYIVIAAGGGGKVGTPSGDAYLAFALKEQE
ncbi:PQQ-binding-like beta-propeller repeat protein [Agriterribacter sp.]|uniref:outer membrane protein assembly factor BamB family protein n=1 Tax=Agriterribacter sp. TaxID=2821509 RepID=UPI002CD4FCC0|nr:PQQ-binding-like beta-propeller repeat protein [Agriterribacter sp.]HRO46710.1 PQQ-binding-like beta-propeller repeat protein [Agriterribacter sp.]HRQ18898.1 PQQ-binding-like beta-propeller repeat protein [Agriterribacter sp.]